MKKEWLILVVLLILDCYVHPQAETRCANFAQKPLETVIIEEGGRRSVFCEYRGDIETSITPPPLNWIKEMSTLMATESINEDCDCFISTLEGTINLTFVEFEASNAGRYRCGAQTTFVDFEFCDFTVAVAEPPVVTLPSEPMILNIGDELLITPTMFMMGVPEATLTWSRSGSATLLDPSDFEQRADGSLRIESVGREDRGRYTVTARNSEGSFVGMDEASINVFVNFVELDRPEDQINDNAIEITCTARGYPPDLTLNWMPTGNIVMDVDMRTFETEVTSTYRLPASECAAGTVYTCVAMAGTPSEQHTYTVMECGVAVVNPPTNVQAVRGGPDQNSFTEIQVTWDAPTRNLPANGYRVQYGYLGSAVQMRDVPAGTTSYLITGLMPGMTGRTYSIQVGSLASPGDNPDYASPSVSVSIPPCTIASEPMPLRGVEARLGQISNRRTINVSWIHEDDAAIARFMVSVEAMSVGGARAVTSVLERSKTSYLLPVSFCNGSMYTITVSALNICGITGPSITVTQTCEVVNGNPLRVEVGTVEPQGIQLMLIPTGTEDISFVLVNATTLEVSPLGTISTSIFQAIEFPLSGVLCIEGLREGTYYNVCVTPVFADGTQGSSVCVQRATTETGSSNLDGCVSAQTVINTTRATPKEFPDWAIAVIVVGALALLALLFCFIGLCFACNTGDNKDDDIASVSSLQASSIVPGSAGPYPNLRRNNMSPHRSCLSYHREGHSTNWNEHRDTLKQMETDIGTNV